MARIRGKKRTRSGPLKTTSPRFAVNTRPKYKHPQIIALSDVAIRFDDACVQKLALAAKWPTEANLQEFKWRLREAAEMFVLERSVPSSNEVRNEIASLHNAAARRAYVEAARRIDDLSLDARAMLGDELPTAAELRDEALRDDAADTAASLCRFGSRAQSQQSASLIIPLLRAPSASRRVLKRDAERNFVERISIGWLKITGNMPPRTARRGRELGPFARFVGECLNLVGATYADPVALINEIGPSLRDLR